VSKQGTRISAVWVALALCAVLLLLPVFILENSQRVDLSYFGAQGTCRWESRSCWLPSRECCSP
jgi:uncharacterized integral membrane protein